MDFSYVYTCVMFCVIKFCNSVFGDLPSIGSICKVYINIGHLYRLLNFCGLSMGHTTSVKPSIIICNITITSKVSSVNPFWVVAFLEIAPLYVGINLSVLILGVPPLAGIHKSYQWVLHGTHIVWILQCMSFSLR